MRQIEYADLKDIKDMDWLDRRVLYVLDAEFGPLIRHTFWNDSNPIDFFVLPLWLLRATWRAMEERMKINKYGGKQ